MTFSTPGMVTLYIDFAPNCLLEVNRLYVKVATGENLRIKAAKATVAHLQRITGDHGSDTRKEPVFFMGKRTDSEEKGWHMYSI